MAVAELPPRPFTAYKAVCPDYEFEGNSSRRLLQQFSAVMHQWQNRPGVQMNSQEDHESTSHLPFAKAGTMKVRYKMAGPMPPRMINFDEASDE